MALIFFNFGSRSSPCSNRPLLVYILASHYNKHTNNYLPPALIKVYFWSHLNSGFLLFRSSHLVTGSPTTIITFQIESQCEHCDKVITPNRCPWVWSPVVGTVGPPLHPAVHWVWNSVVGTVGPPLHPAVHWVWNPVMVTVWQSHHSTQLCKGCMQDDMSKHGTQLVLVP